MHDEEHGSYSNLRSGSNKLMGSSIYISCREMYTTGKLQHNVATPYLALIFTKHDEDLEAGRILRFQNILNGEAP